MDKKGENCIYELSYLNNFTNPAKELFDIRALNAKEKQLMTVRDELIGKVFTPNYKIGIVDGFDFNIQLIPYALGYKLYLISGTSKSDLIPFGNDYLFFADKRGAITSWRKFHSRIIPTMTKYKGETVMSVMHSHLPQEPFITATDICTFKLYGGLAGLKSFKVLSTALNKVFSYDLEGDRIGVEEM